jgi:hypothetical protein
MQSAANRLLKILEEPPQRSAIILTSDAPRSLLPTILSRTVRWRISPPAQDDALAYLTTRVPGSRFEAQLQALEQAGLVPQKAAERLERESPTNTPDWLDFDMVVAGEKYGRKKDIDVAKMVNEWEMALNQKYRRGVSSDPMSTAKRRQWGRRVRGMVGAKVAINRQLLVEQLRYTQDLKNG